MRLLSKSCCWWRQRCFAREQPSVGPPLVKFLAARLGCLGRLEPCWQGSGFAQTCVRISGLQFLTVSGWRCGSSNYQIRALREGGWEASKKMVVASQTASWKSEVAPAPLVRKLDWRLCLACRECSGKGLRAKVAEGGYLVHLLPEGVISFLCIRGGAAVCFLEWTV